MVRFISTVTDRSDRTVRVPRVQVVPPSYSSQQHQKSVEGNVNLAFLRAVGNYGLIINTIFGQFFDMKTALLVGLVLSAVSIPYYAKHKLWDTVIFIVFMMCINLTSALHGVPGCNNN
jgi:hypothetical protein